MSNSVLYFIKSVFFGLAVGDALGVPVEFLTRGTISQDPLRDMREFGTHNQPKGTWSDDSSMTFCCAESLSSGYDLNDMSKLFVKWLYEGLWTPHGCVFDVGNATRKALGKVRRGESPKSSGETHKYSNGNGSLMRISPLIFLRGLNTDEHLKNIEEVSAITHGHRISIIACQLYVFIAIALMDGKDFENAVRYGLLIIFSYYQDSPERGHLKHFKRIVEGISNLRSSDIKSSGYVIDSLEASLWSLSKSKSYGQAVLLAVNLGEDTDTIGAITGSLAGLIYGFDAIPDSWINVLVRKDDIEDLCNKFSRAMEEK